MSAKNVRLYVASPLSLGTPVLLDSDQTRYLSSVLRVRLGEKVTLFNEIAGDWESEVTEISKKSITLTPGNCIRSLQSEPEIHLYFSPLKSHRQSLLLEKTTEAGVTHLHPVIFQHTQLQEINLEKSKRQLIEAVEQSGRQRLPTLFPPLKFEKFIDDVKDPIIVADERRPSLFLLDCPAPSPAHILIGPEGGYSPSEFKAFDKSPRFTCVNLGYNTLRAETAAILAVGILHMKLTER